MVASQVAVIAPTFGETITCKAAVAYEANKPMSFEDIHVAPPAAGEVRIKIANAAICQSDLYFWKGKDKDHLFPRILGHEAAGIVESIGKNVKDVKVGDHVIPVWQAECRKCFHCKAGKSNICDTFMYNFNNGYMPSDKKTTRFSRVKDGKPIYHFFGTSTFSQYTVVDEACVTAVNPNAALDKICLLGCGVPTGMGSVWKIAEVTPGSTVAVFGLGTIGLATVEGAKVAGASRIIGIDRNPAKLKLGEWLTMLAPVMEDAAMSFGTTDTIDMGKIDTPVEEVISKMTDGGVQYSFDCTGSTDIMYSAMESTQKAGGVAVIIGLAASTQKISFAPESLLYGRKWTSGLFGGFKGRTDLPGLVEKYMDGEINLDHYITDNLPFSQINKAFDLLNTGKCLRCVLHFDE